MASPTDRGRSVLAVAAALALAAASTPSPAQEVPIQGPMNVLVSIPAQGGACGMSAQVSVPADAPADLRVAGWISDRDGGWFQTAQWTRLAPGVRRLTFSFAREADLVAMPSGARWDPEAQARMTRCGLCFSTADLNRAHVQVDALAIAPIPAAAVDPAARGALVDLACEPTALACGSRWQCLVRPTPFPCNPYDPAEFALDAEITAQDGSRWAIPGFCIAPMRERDRGDHVVLTRDGASAFAVRFRPRRPGRYQVRLIARWRGQPPLVAEATTLEVRGAPAGRLRAHRRQRRALLRHRRGLHLADRHQPALALRPAQQGRAQHHPHPRSRRAGV